ncbi:molybdopterin-dependent oxidoreductase [Nocardioides sp. R-C-SC26]|uniref:molybdopterin-dependent oxidoreductase n=1 Tax=Nocardioides sp. R-C-SC26 TaxID=2870414 RepID=UPI001E3B3B4F|nr:molybdopterin-dependent oxidoreductase [Nocardioides sp. R-C-SC26]
MSTLVGMGIGHLVAALLNPDSSPVLAVGSQVIDLTPVSMKEWAIRTFETENGNLDKVVLVGSVFVGVLVLAAVAGVLARTRLLWGAALLIVMVAAAAGAAMNRPSADALDLVPSLITALTGVLTLVLLDRLSRGASLSVALSPAPTKKRLVLTEDSRDGVSPDTSATATPTEEDATVTSSASATRRTVLVAGAVLTAIAAAAGGAGRWIGTLRARPEDIALPDPSPGGALGPLQAGLEERFSDITPLRVSNADFYRVDTRLDTPVVDSEGWTLTVDGDVENELTITFDELLAMPMVERDITLTCVSNSVGGKYVGGARWLGVPLKDVLDMAGVGSKADQILSTDFDGMTISTPLDLATDGREALIAVGMNGEALPREHGFPVRLVIPGLYGFISATKWLTKITLTTYAEQESYWTKRNWDTVAPIKPSARIDTPRALTTLDPGEVLVGGVAWAQNNDGVTKVQVQIDGDGWVDAELGPDVNDVYWRQWYYQWTDAKPGSHKIAARVVDGEGEVQTAARAEPFPGGSSGIHTFLVTVAG